jgi:hypothetical protein
MPNALDGNWKAILAAAERVEAVNSDRKLKLAYLALAKWERRCQDMAEAVMDPAARVGGVGCLDSFRQQLAECQRLRLAAQTRIRLLKSAKTRINQHRVLWDACVAAAP